MKNNPLQVLQFESSRTAKCVGNSDVVIGNPDSFHCAEPVNC
jgi:hypothetical protein